MIVCSAPRTGSTLVWQVASRLLPDETVEKFHGPEMLEFMTENPGSREPVIIPVRDRVDAYLSLLRTSRFDGEEEPWLAAIRAGDVFTHVEQAKREFAAVDIVRSAYKGKMMELRYDVFSHLPNWLFDHVAKFAGLRPAPEERTRILEETSLQANRERQKKLSGFSEYDRVSKIHGNHIWDIGDRLGFGLAFMLSPDIREKLTKELNS